VHGGLLGHDFRDGPGFGRDTGAERQRHRDHTCCQ
jgi:hypothetical protein